MASTQLKVPALAIILFFAFGAWCSNLAASNLPILTPQQGELGPGCREGGLGSSNATLRAPPGDGLLKGAKLQGVKLSLSGVSEKTPCPGQDSVSTSHIIAAPKTPLHLFHSVLLL